MTRTTMAVIYRWLYAKRVVREQQYRDRAPILRCQLEAMRGSYPA